MSIPRDCSANFFTKLKNLISCSVKFIWWTATLKLPQEIYRRRSERNLARFAARYGFDHDALRNSRNFRVEAATGFDGKVAVLRLTEVGRFGNIVLQMLHAITLARHIDVRKIEIFPFEGGPPEGLYFCGGLTVEVGPGKKATQPTLIGPFCHSSDFGTVLHDNLLVVARDVIAHVMRPFFIDLLAPIQDEPDNQLVINLRGGDIFQGPVIYSWYVQPPASFYVAAALHARQMFGIKRVTLVAQDRLNPALDVTIRSLVEEGFDVTFHCKGFAADLQLIIQARHVVAPFGTFCEAIAMLSTSLRSYTAFRQFESHRHEHLGRECLLLHVIRARGVLPILIKDTALDYIPPLHWDRTAEQVRMMRDFPLDRLTVELPQDNADDFCVATFRGNVPPHIRP